MSEGDETAKLWKVNRTIHELVRDRGFLVSDEEIHMSLDDFRKMYSNQTGTVDRNQLNFYTTSRTNPTDQIFVFFTDEKSVGVKTMRKLLGILEEKSIQRGIIVFPGNMTPSARKVIVAMASQFRLEEFSEADLLVNIVHHALVPRHDVLTPEEKKILLEKYRLKETQLPRIQLADPVARYYGFVADSETSGRYASYRICF
ncbi:RNA polymerase [Cyathus striatus]|nr:RNA polymerase [Cyathus striatus]